MFNIPCLPVAGEDYRNLKDKNFGETLVRNLEISYPLSTPAVKEIRFSTLYELIDEIRRVYIEIYDEERKTTTDYQESASLLNRGKSNGRYGIWGHDMEDLVIEMIEIKDNDINIFIGS